MRLAGKSALITGGASGIGLATVRKFIDEGAKVAVADIAADRAQEVVDTLPEGSAVAVGVDVSVFEEV